MITHPEQRPEAISCGASKCARPAPRIARADGLGRSQTDHPAQPVGQFNDPRGIAVDDAGNVYVVDSVNQRIQKFGPVPTPTKATSWGRLKHMYR